MGNNNDKYIRNLAVSLMGQLGIRTDVCLGPQCLYDAQYSNVENVLRRMNPETLGKIVACGRRPKKGKTGWLEIKILNPFWDNLDGGLGTLAALACAVVIAEMNDVCVEHLHRRDEYLAACSTDG